MFHIIDDELTLCELTKSLLISIGIESLIYTNPVGYCDYMHSESYQKPIAIFTDIEMPEMNGYELIDRIIKKHPDSKIVIISGFSNDTYKGKHDHIRFLHKPYNVKEFLELSKTLAGMTF